MKASRLLTFLLAAAALFACRKEELKGPEYNPDAVAFTGTATFTARLACCMNMNTAAIPRSKARYCPL